MGFDVVKHYFTFILLFFACAVPRVVLGLQRLLH